LMEHEINHGCLKITVGWKHWNVLFLNFNYFFLL
jgi:hypothetical protein